MFRIQKRSQFTIEKGHRQQQSHTKYIIDKDHAEFGQFNVLCRKFHIQDVAARRQAVGHHPKQARGRNMNIILCRRDGSQEHNRKGGYRQTLRLAAKKEIITGRRNNVGDIFEHSDHGHRIGFQRDHSGKEHETKEDVDGCPSTGGFPIQRRVLYPVHHPAYFDTDGRNDGLKDDEEYIEVPINQVIVTEEQEEV